MKRKDINQAAFSIVQQATGEATERPVVDPKKKAAQDSGRLGGLIGGVVRATKLTSEQRAEIAKKAAAARWG